MTRMMEKQPRQREGGRNTLRLPSSHSPISCKYLPQLNPAKCQLTWDLWKHKLLLFRVEQENSKKGTWKQISKGLSKKGDCEAGGDYYYYFFLDSFKMEKLSLHKEFEIFIDSQSSASLIQQFMLPPNTLHFILSFFTALVSYDLQFNAWISFIILFMILPKANPFSLLISLTYTLGDILVLFLISI